MMFSIHPNATGTLAGGARLIPNPGVLTGCEVVSDDSPDQFLTPGSEKRVIQTREDPTLAGGGRTNRRGQWIHVWMLRTGLPSEAGSTLTTQVRCDQDSPEFRVNPGCVNIDYHPTIVYDQSDLPEFVDHLKAAQESGLPGAPGGTPLHRLFDAALQQKNRDTACPASFPRPSGKTCDEYPFASSQEGAFTGGGTARTFPFCSITLPDPPSTSPTGYSVCMINDLQNSRAGSQLGSFNSTFRMLDGDAYFVGTQK